MEYIRVSNTEGTTIINDSFKNLALKEVITTPTQGAFGYQINSYNEPHFVINKKDDDLVFVAPNGKDAFNKGFMLKITENETELLTPSYQEGIFNGYGPFTDTWGIADTSSMCGVRHSPSSPHSFKCFVYSTDYKKSNEGLEVYDEHQKLIFSSANKYLQVKKYIYVDDIVKKYVSHNQWGVGYIEGSENYPPEEYEPYTYWGVVGSHIKIAEYKFDKPIAVCPVSTPSCIIGTRGSSCIFFYYSFIDERTIGIYAEISVAHATANHDDAPETEYFFDDVVTMPVGNNKMLGVLVTEIE